jgi:hypothetical protein
MWSCGLGCSTEDQGSQVQVPVIPDHFYLHIFTSAAHLWSSDLLICSALDQRIPAFESRSYPISFIFTSSPVQLNLFIKIPHWDHSKRVGESPHSQASNSKQSRNHWASLVPNYSDTDTQCANAEEKHWGDL